MPFAPAVKLRVLLVVASLAVSHTFESAAGAQPGAPAAGFDPNRVFREGLEQYDAGNVRAAIDTWEQLVRTVGESRAWKALYNLGLAYQRQGDVTRAIERLEAFGVFVRAQAEVGADLADRRDDAAERVRALKAGHAAVRVLASSGTDVEIVRVGTAEARPAGFTVYLAPGPHAFEVHVGTNHARKVVLELKAGEERTLATSEPAPSRSFGPEPAPAPAPAPSRKLPIAWLVGGAAVTLASGVLPLVLGLDTHHKRETARALGREDPAYPGAVDDYEGARTRYYVSLALPAVLAITTAVVVLVTMSGERRADAR